MKNHLHISVATTLHRLRRPEALRLSSKVIHCRTRLVHQSASRFRQPLKFSQLWSLPEASAVIEVLLPPLVDAPKRLGNKEKAILRRFRCRSHRKEAECILLPPIKLTVSRGGRACANLLPQSRKRRMTRAVQQTPKRVASPCPHQEEGIRQQLNPPARWERDRPCPSWGHKPNLWRNWEPSTPPRPPRNKPTDQRLPLLQNPGNIKILFANKRFLSMNQKDVCLH
mmetsp:Transcript_5304/g.11726  ORF Transcript_5304/g.11726 Transcript_5304/m.11726 type:complete len:226 (-) Transcript_5304:1392-2069(-)